MPPKPVAAPSDEAVRNRRFVAAGAKRIAPLLVAQLSEPFTRPRHVTWGNVLEQLLVPAVIVELDETVLHAGDERLALEDVGVAALPRQTSGLTERRAEIADHIPAVHRSTLVLQLVERVVLVFEIRAIEHHQDDQQALVRPRADERILLPRPFAGVLDRFLGQAKTPARLYMRAFPVADRQRRQKVDRRLRVADGREDAGERHFDRSFGALVIVGRLLDVPLPAERVLNRHARIGTMLFAQHEGVRRVRVRRPLASPRSIEQVACRDVVGPLPELRHVRLPWQHRRLDLRGAEGMINREYHRNDASERARHCRVLSGNEWNNGRTTGRRRRSLQRVGDFEKHPPSLCAVTDVEAREGRGRVVHAESGAVRRFQMREVEIARARRHLARVDKGGSVNVREQRPARFRAERLHVVVVKPVVVVPAQRVLPAQARHEIEGDNVTARRIRKHLPPVERQDPFAVEERNELRRLDLVPTKAIGARIAVRVTRGRCAIQTAAGRMTRVVAPIGGNRHVAVQKRRLRPDARR